MMHLFRVDDWRSVFQVSQLPERNEYSLNGTPDFLDTYRVQETMKQAFRQFCHDDKASEMKYMRRTASYTWTDHEKKCTNCKGFKNNTNFGQITGIHEKLDTTCK